MPLSHNSSHDTVLISVVELTKQKGKHNRNVHCLSCMLFSKANLKPLDNIGKTEKLECSQIYT